MENLQIIALTHKEAPLEWIGKLHIEEQEREEKLRALKEVLEVQELAYISTCNRVEFVLSSNSYFCKGREHRLLEFLGVQGPEKAEILGAFKAWRGEEAMRHLLEVGASLDSMVLGEREIITQVRKGFDDARSYKISGDLLRLVSKKVIETSKSIYTNTAIATRPVSVVSLAWKQFAAKQFDKETPVLLIGAGQTNGNFARFLAKNGYTNVTVANRGLDRAEQLAANYGWKAVQLFHIPRDQAFRAIITCTGSQDPIVTEDFLRGITHARPFIIDMAVPADVCTKVQEDTAVEYIGMTDLQAQAKENLAVRQNEIEKCTDILDQAMEDFRIMIRQREVELAMREIPGLIKAIKETALGEVFAKDLDSLDGDSKVLLEKIIAYMEKKYISVPMKLAREVMLENAGRN